MENQLLYLGKIFAKTSEDFKNEIKHKKIWNPNQVSDYSFQVDVEGENLLFQSLKNQKRISIYNNADNAEVYINEL